MFKHAALAVAATAAFVAVPASAATVVYHSSNPGGNVTLAQNGPGAVSSPITFTVRGTAGNFTATFNFTNPYDPAAATGSASFDFDPDVVNFTGGSFGTGSTFSIRSLGTGSAITVSLANLGVGPQTLTLSGSFNPDGRPAGGNSFAQIGGSINLAGAIPEPTTWALFILGFGAIGHTMRRRSAKVGVAKASLNFA